MTAAWRLFENAIAWLRQEYGNLRFFAERDIVFNLQTHILQAVTEQALPYKVFNDHPIPPRKRRADLAILDLKDGVLVAVELKYEPAHSRSGVDILPSKFPVICWEPDGVVEDIRRVQEFVREGAVRVAYSVFVDEGGYCRHRQPPHGSEWIDWGISAFSPHNVWILWCKVEAGPEGATNA